jgi:hypothetical protein
MTVTIIIKVKGSRSVGGNVSMLIAIPEKELLVQLEVIELGIIL